MLNLLDNAVKYSKDQVRVEVSLWSDAARRAHLRVADQGVGMTRAHLRFVFNRFYRIGAEVRRSHTGTGLGLFIVRAVARRHKGEVLGRQPRPRQGLDVHADRAGRFRRCGGCLMAAPGTVASPRILVVEDEEHLADGIRFNLEAEGYEVDVVGDGTAALQQITAGAERYDLVILDLMLPGLDGFEVATRARQQGDLTPILMLTAKCTHRGRGPRPRLSAPTTTCRSRSTLACCWRGCAACCGAATGPAPLATPGRRRCRSASRPSTS